MSNAFLEKHSAVMFHNGTKSPIKTVIGDIAVEVPAGGNLELPKRLAWVVAARGLRLTEGPSPDANAPEAMTTRYKPAQPPRPRSVELGEIKKRAQEENETAEGDGEAIEGDDDADDPLVKATEGLEAAGVDPASLPGGRRQRKTALRGVQ